MHCDGQKKNLIIDLDGSFQRESGNPGTIISDSAYAWNDPHRGVGDLTPNRVPIGARTYPNGSAVAIDDKYPNKGKFISKTRDEFETNKKINKLVQP